jgi:hypothetical protein
MPKASTQRNEEVSIWKFFLKIQDEQLVEMPLGAQLLHVEIMDDQLCLWAQVWTKAIKEKRLILVRDTGHSFTGEEKRYVGTTVHPVSGQLHNFVWHVYDGGSFNG